MFENGATHQEPITILDNESNTLSITTTDFSVAEEIGATGFVVDVALSEATRFGCYF